MKMLRYNIIFMVALGIINFSNFGLSMLTNNDPYPMYTTADPHNFLNVRAKQALKGFEVYGPPEILQFSLSGFRQSANFGNNFRAREVPLGDLYGTWNVLGLFYPEANCVDLNSPNTDIQNLLFETLCINSEEQRKCFNKTPLQSTDTDFINLADPEQTDIQREFGFFSVPVKYRKYGLRVDADIQLHCNFACKIQMGVADIRQTPSFVDLTCSATGLSCPVRGCGFEETDETPCTSDETTECVDRNCCIDIFDCDCKRLTIDQIMKEFKPRIAPALGLNVREFHETAFEDIRFILYWRKMYDINRHRPTWARFIMTPFVEAGFTAPTGKPRCPTQLFSLPFGNDGHWSAGLNGGFTIDWVDTVEIGFEAGFTAFSKRIIHNYPVPTNEQQSGVYPRKATIQRDPGTNWSFAGTLSTYHFLDRLSFYAQYVFISHGQDCIEVLCTDAPSRSNIVTKKLIEQSKWESSFINVGFNYDISPNIALGLLWQAPVKRRNAYNSTTLMASIIVTY